MMHLSTKKYLIPSLSKLYKSLTNFVFLKLQNHQLQLEQSSSIFFPNTFHIVTFNSNVYILPLYLNSKSIILKSIYSRPIVKTKASFKYMDTLFKTLFFLLNNRFETNIILSGLGFKYEIKKNTLYLNIGYSHYFKIYIPTLLKIVALETSTFNVKSISNSTLGNFICALTKLKRINPYTADGISFFKTLYLA